MKLTLKEERLISTLIIQEDVEAIYSLLSSKHDPIFSLEILPYYALFINECQSHLGINEIPHDIALQIKDIRNYIKAYTNGYGKTSSKIKRADIMQDEAFRKELKFDFPKSWNMHLNMGTYWTENKKIIGNTQHIAAYLGIDDVFAKDVGVKQRELGYQIGVFINSIRSGFSKAIPSPNSHRTENAVSITKYFDLNTNKENKFFIDNVSKELNLLYVHLLCNMNFVRYILRPLFTDSSTWLFRIEYIVTYHTYLALNDLKNHSNNNNDISLEKNSIEEILEFGRPLFQSKFRNCMMHYDLAGYNVLSREYIKCPFYGIVETCFEGKDYHSYLAELRNLSDMIIDYLENRFDFSKVKLQEI
jgi:hypothetical protein